MHRYQKILAAGLVLLPALVAQAQVTSSTGSGSAVSTVDASASFESELSLFGNPYVEDGLSFTRTNLTFNNNSCGFAGCKPDPFHYFPGNYMYGTGSSGYFSLFAPVGQLFQGLEFMAGTGYFDEPMTQVAYQAFLGGLPVGSGSFSVDIGTVVGFSSITGFDELRYTDTFDDFNAPAFDEVRADFLDATTIPEPSSVLLLATGLIAVFGAVRRNAARRNRTPIA